MKLKSKYRFCVRSNNRKCCLCLSNVLPSDNSCELLLNNKKSDKTFTELGKMLIAILKLSNNTITKYCCQVCIEAVVKCFDALLEINVAASLASQQSSVTAGCGFKCYKCKDILTSIDAFTLHVKCHLLNACDESSWDDYESDDCGSPLDSVYEKSDKESDINEEEDRLQGDIGRSIDGGQDKSTRTSNLCHECGKSFGSAHSLKLHIKRHDPHFKSPKRRSRIKGNHLCDKCGKSFSTLETLRVHREKHDTTCSVCGKSMYKKYMKRHLLKHDSQGSRLQWEQRFPRKVPALDSTPLQCDHCDKSYSNRFLLVNHIAMMHGGSFEKRQKRGRRRGIECSVCGQVLSSEPKLKLHRQEEHGVTTEDRIQCELCKRWYSGKMCLRTHIKHEHMQAKPFSCKLCPKVFKRYQGLWAHMRVHKDLRPYECGVCQVRYRQRYEVVNHLGKHVRAGDVNLDQAYAKVVQGTSESHVIYFKDQKVKEVSDILFTS